MASYRAYELKGGRDGKPKLIWWDGKRIRASSDDLLLELKRLRIPNNIHKPELVFGDGEEFFDNLFRSSELNNGYSWLVETEVNEKGEKIK